MRDRVLRAFRSRPWLFAAGSSLVLLIANVAADPDFGDPGNWPQQLATLAPLALVAFASTPAIVAGGGGLDLSVGPLAIFLNVFLVRELLPGGLQSPVVSIPLLLGLGLVVGACNGILVARLRYVPVIATICTLFVLTGLALKVGTDTRPLGANWTTDVADTVGPVPGALILLAFPVAVWLVARAVGYHRALYAVGGNDVAAYSAGVDVAGVRTVAYALGGLFAAVAAIAITALVQSAQSGTIPFYVLAGLTAVALGGVPLSGGRGGLTGAFFGACTLYLIQTLLGSLDVANDWVNVVYGLTLIVSVLLGAAAIRYRATASAGVAA
jgi:ribose transport system permease protein